MEKRAEINGQKFPAKLVVAVIALCISPSLLMLVGVDFSSPEPAFDILTLSQLSPNEQVEGIFQLSSGSFIHTILEWTGFCVAICTVFLAYSHYKLHQDFTIPVLATALFCAACLDAFHTLAADRLIDAVAANTDLIPFTWAISRTFNALILIFGISILFFLSIRKYEISFRMMLSICTFFLAISFLIIHYCANSLVLPQTMFPESFITRPWDVGPLILFILAGLFLFPRYFEHFPNVFAYSLMISMIPQIATELHMAFGSTALFDAHFNVAHFLKIVAYGVPAVGLALYFHRVKLAQELEKGRAAYELKGAKNDQIAAEEVAHHIVNNALETIITIDQLGLIQAINPAGEGLFGYTSDELTNQNIKVLMPSPYREHHDGYLANYLENRGAEVLGSDLTSRDLIGKRKDESTFPMELSLTEVILGGKRLYTGIIRDLSKRLQTQQRLQLIFDAAPNALIMVNKTGEIVLANQVMGEMFDYKIDEIIGKNIEIFLPEDIKQKHPGLSSAYFSRPEKKRMGIGRELFGIKKDGSKVPVEIGLSPLVLDEEEMVISSIIDITERRQAVDELAASVKALTLSNEELERFAYIASHDLQEPLRMVASYTSLLAKRYKGKLDDDADEFIGFAVDGASRMQGMIRDLLAFSRVGSKKKPHTEVDLTKLVEQLVEDYQLQTKENNCEISLGELPTLMAGKSHMRQLFQNLISNAIKYSDKTDTRIHQ